MLRDRAGNAVVLSGRNRGKIDRIQSSLDGGLHALVDKPWILEAADLPKLERALDTADSRKLVALDIMTERHEVTSELQRELVNDPATFGTLVRGTEADPGVYMESVHHLMKVVAGAPNIRPTWFFDTDEQGEGLNDIGTHLVDLVQWTLFPDQALDYRKDVRVVGAQRWPTMIPRDQFRRVTGQDIPAALSGEGQGRRPRVLLQHARLLHRARRAREAQRHLGLGGAGGGGRLALRLLPRVAREGRDPPGDGGEVPARALRHPQHGRGQGGGPGRRAEEDGGRAGRASGRGRGGPRRPSCGSPSPIASASATRTTSPR